MEGDAGAKVTQDIHTYHCICTNLLLASTSSLASLSRRISAQDKAYILPLLGFRNTDLAGLSLSDGQAGHSGAAASAESGERATLLSTISDRKPIAVRREDGFEQRYLQHCSRCNLVFGYHLDWSQFSSSSLESNGAAAAALTDNNRRVGRRDDIVFLLPGGLLSTDEMVQGTGKHD